MTRILAGAAASLLLVTGAFLLWQGRAGDASVFPEAPPARSGQPSMLVASVVPQAPEATAKSREQKRFSRVDKDKDGRVEREEVFAPRRKAFAKLDTNGNGSLSFEAAITQSPGRAEVQAPAPVRSICRGLLLSSRQTRRRDRRRKPQDGKPSATGCRQRQMAWRARNAGHAVPGN